MRRIALATVALVIAAVACQEVATSPDPSATADLTARYRVGNPPPPPIDTGAQVTVAPAAQSTPTGSYNLGQGFTIRLASSVLAECEGTPSFVLPVTYFYDPAANSGWLHVTDAPFDAVDTDANGMVRMRADEFGDQTFTGKGSVAITIEGCEFVIPLSSVTDASSFGECLPPNTPPDEGAPRRQGCFVLHFDQVLLNGDTDVGDALFTPTEECTAESDPRTRPECEPAIESPPIIIEIG